jgi:hypothetical protein
MVDRVITLRGRGARGESFSDVARRVGDLNGIEVPPTATDDEVMDLFIDAVGAEAAVPAQAAQAAAEAARDEAEDARDVAVAAAATADNVYLNTAAGLAATADGGSFWVEGTDAETLDLYRDIAGVATLIGRFMISSVKTVRAVDKISDLRVFIDPSNKQMVRSLGHFALGDGYSREYVFDAASMMPDTDGYSIRPDAIDPDDPGRFISVSRTPFRGIAPLANVVSSAVGDYAIAGQHGDDIYGILRAGSADLYVTQDCVNWTFYCTTPNTNGNYKVFLTDDGEALLLVDRSEIYRSDGFTTSPGTMTAGDWTKTFDLADYPELVGHIEPFNFSGSGHKFIVTHYEASWPGQNWERYGFISLDAGATWTKKYDSHDLHGSSGNHGHMHGVEYDPWDDAFYIIEGHGTNIGIYRSHNDGTTWNELTFEVVPSNAPTTITATDKGLVLTSDAEQQRGVLFLARPTDRTDYSSMIVRFIHEIQDTVLVENEDIIGFGSTAYRDPRTGIVYVGWSNSYQQYPFLTASDGESSSTIYIERSSIGVAVNPTISRIVVTKDDQIFFSVLNGDGTTNKDIVADVQYGLDRTRLIDQGRMWGGNARGTLPNQNTSVAVGPRSSVNGRQGVAVGQGAIAGTGVATISSIAIGYKVEATGNAAIAIGGVGTTANAAGAINIGGGAMATQSSSIKIGSGGTIGLSAIAIGVGAGTSGFNHTNVGNGAAGQTCVGAGATGATSVGLSAVSASGGVAVGASAVTAGNNATAVGSSSSAAHADSVAIGNASTTTATAQVKIGTRHIEFVELASDPAAPAANAFRFYGKDNGSGKTQACIRFATGAVLVLGTEP